MISMTLNCNMHGTVLEVWGGGSCCCKKQIKGSKPACPT